MQVVFLNTLEKQNEHNRMIQAQVSICEKEGMWTVLWTEPEGSSGEGQQVWFEGTSWEEMISSFRYGIAVQMGAGYVPVVDGMLEERRVGGGTGAGGFLSVLHCYGELNADPELWGALRDWRRSKAAEERKAAYLIANNKMLWMISAFVPHTSDELLQLPGWGVGKNALYGPDILAITQNHERTTTFPLEWVSDTIDPAVYAQWLYKQKENKYKGEVERHREKRHILGGIQAGRSLSEMEHELEIPRRDLLERIEQLEAEGYDLDTLLDRELLELSETEQDKIMSALREVGDKYLKPILKAVYAEDELQGKPLDLFYERLRLMRLRYRSWTSRKAI
jgi:biotin operon repressor